MLETGHETNPQHHLLHRRLDGDIVASLDDWQRHAINDALETAKWSNEHPLNLRLSVPFFTKRFYLTIVGGPEQRTHARLKEERHTHPVRSVINLLFAVGVVGGAAILMLLILALYSSILEF
ncbi:hypothetical protein [Terasakiella sp.]|uniref:hypothetical protein n=1 Tax=Terasakiella sp. TaxID=2034861 RepID=UPI003AA81D4D